MCVKPSGCSQIAGVAALGLAEVIVVASPAPTANRGRHSHVQALMQH